MQPEKTTRTIKQQLAALAPTLEQLGKQKKERIKEFADIMSRIEQIRGELAGSLEIGQQVAIPQINEDDLTDEKLRDFQSQLQELEKKKVFISLLHLLCSTPYVLKRTSQIFLNLDVCRCDLVYIYIKV
jgi:protein regulator of cytokinesis 1